MMYDVGRIISVLKNSSAQKRLWGRYQDQNSYADGIKYEDIMETVKEFTKKIGLER